MKKPIKLIIILIIILTGGLILGSLSTKMRVKNIFDEIYYVGVRATNEPFEKPRSVLENIPNIESQVYYLSSISENGEKITEERYQAEKLPEGITNLSMTFYSKKKELTINVSYNITDTVSLSIDNTYSVSKKTLTQTVSFFDDERKGEIFIKNKTDVKSYLTKYNISEKQLDIWNKQGLNDILLKDWLTIYPSNYSPTNFGNVLVKTEW